MNVSNHKGTKTQKLKDIFLNYSCCVFVPLWLVSLSILQLRITGAALPAPARIESTACFTANVHRPGKPRGDERTAAEYPDQDGSIQ